MRCHQQWEWSSFNRGNAYTPLLNKPALSIGSLWHATQAEWCLNPNSDPNALCAQLSLDQLERIKTDYIRLVGSAISDVELNPFYEGVSLVMAMTKNYQEFWGSPLPDQFEMMQPEQTVLIPIPNTEHVCECTVNVTNPNVPEPDCKLCDGSGTAPHYLSGTLDGLIRSKDGRWWVLERKTYGNRPKIEILDRQDQFLAYLYILYKLGIGDVGGIAYDGAWKRSKPPKGSTMEDLFIRKGLHRNINELLMFEQQLTLLSIEMANNPPIYRNVPFMGCWDCSYQTPCDQKFKGEDYEWTLKTQFNKRQPTEDSTRELKHAEVD